MQQGCQDLPAKKKHASGEQGGLLAPRGMFALCRRPQPSLHINPLLLPVSMLGRVQVLPLKLQDSRWLGHGCFAQPLAVRCCLSAAQAGRPAASPLAICRA